MPGKKGQQIEMLESELLQDGALHLSVPASAQQPLAKGSTATSKVVPEPSAALAHVHTDCKKKEQPDSPVLLFSLIHPAHVIHRLRGS